MKKLFKNLFLFLGLLLVVSIALRILLFNGLSSPTGSKILNSKVYDLKKYPDVNTLFLGSSRVYRHFNTNVIDSLSFGEINSYNLGAPNTFNPEIYTFYDNLLKKSFYNLNIKYIFIEMASIRAHGANLPLTFKEIYWINSTELLWIIKKSIEDIKIKFSFKKFRKYKKFFYHSIGYLQNCYNWGVMNQNINNEKILNDINLQIGNKGYVPLDHAFKHTNNENDKKNWYMRKQDLINNPKQLEKRLQNYLNLELKDKVNSIDLQRINKMIEESKILDIKLFFFLSPNNPKVEDLYTLFMNIPASNRIEIEQESQIKNLFQIENSFDKGHLNKTGSRYFSKIFTKSVIKKIK